jgi:hypothetical protein
MTQNIYYAPKHTGTYADALTAFGLAVLLDNIIAHAPEARTRASQLLPRSIEIADAGPYYEIRTNRPIQQDWLDKLSFFQSPAPFLISRKVKEVPPATASRDVDATWDLVRAYAEQRRALYGQGVKGTDIEKQLEDQEPPHDWQVVAFLGDWRMQAQNIYNRFVASWASIRPHFAEHLKTILALYAHPHAPRAKILQIWRKIAKEDDIKYQDTASQLFNPHQGKGLNESKANALRMDNVKDRPWPEEFLKAVGLWQCVAPRQTTDSKDWKVYVIAPRTIQLHDLRSVYHRFNKFLWRERKSDVTSLKTDITSILLFYRAWLDYVETTSEDKEEDFDAEIANPQNVIHGFFVTQFKLLSRNAYTMVNQSFLRLPGWGRTIQTRADMSAVRGLIDEHLDIIHGMDESHSDGYELLRRYRDFVAGEDWDAFFDFCAGYAHEILRRYNEGRWVPLFSTTHLRRLFMTQKKFAPILENEGFRNVAYAIRHSTIVPQGRKARGQDNLYEIRYGLGAELKRKSTVPEEFIAALTDFMQNYNQENVQKAESRGQQMRKDLRTSDIEEIVHLVDEYGSETVANLLIACGYAREPREEA